MQFHCMVVIHFSKYIPEEYTENREKQNPLKKRKQRRRDILIFDGTSVTE